MMPLMPVKFFGQRARPERSVLQADFPPRKFFSPAENKISHGLNTLRRIAVMSKVLVIQLARMGDVLQSSRLLNSLRRHHEVHLCVEASLAAFTGLVFPFAVVHGIHAHGKPECDRLLYNRAAFSDLREAGFSHVYNLNFSGMNLALSTLFDPEIVRGHRLERGQPMRDKWVDLAFRWTERRQVSPLNLADYWAFFETSPLPGPEVNPCAVPKGGGIGVALAGRAARRSLPPTVLAPILSAVFERESMRNGRASKVFLLGTSREYALARQIMRLLPSGVGRQVQDLTGKTSLENLVELVAGFDLLLSPDTGLMHLGAHLGVPVEAFFLSSAWSFETGPYGKGHEIWQAAPGNSLNCVPCMEARNCPSETRCLAPFSSPEFLARLKGREQTPVPGIIFLKTEFDEIGVVCRPVSESEPDIFSRQRAAMRALVGEWLGINPASDEAVQVSARSFFKERDWMLPPSGITSF